jgi:hypothetical protein
LDSEFILFLIISRDLDSDSDVFQLVEFLKVVKNEKLPEEAAVNYRSEAQYEQDSEKTLSNRSDPSSAACCYLFLSREQRLRASRLADFVSID